MKIRFSAKSSATRDAVVVTTLNDAKLLATAKKIDDKTAGALTRAVKATGFTGKFYENVHIPGPANENAKHVFVKGLGTKGDMHPLDAENIGRSLTDIFNEHSAHRIDVELEAHSPAETAANMAFGAMLNSYSFDVYKSDAKAGDTREINFVVDDPAAARKAFEKLQKIAGGEKLARDLGQTPPNDLYPESFAEKIKNEFANSNVKVRVLDEKEMAKLGMGSMLAVGQGSTRPPRLVVMEYMGGAKDASPLAFGR